MSDKLLIVGIDGGATKVSGWAAERRADGTFMLGRDNVQKKYREYSAYDPEFRPVDIKIQLGEMNGDICLTDDEKRQGLAYMHATADVISELVRKNPGRRVLAGIGMPGLKTADRRGISVLANGPRMPEYSTVIESRLKSAGIELAAPVHHLGSDADYCGLGEEYSADGQFRRATNSYYLGGGTGVADALKLRGELLPFDAIKPWMAKAWEMKAATGRSMERYCSASGIQAIYSEYSGISIAELNAANIYAPQIMDRISEGDTAAEKTVNEVSFYIAELLFERMSTIYGGSSGHFDFVNPARAALNPEHEYKGVLLDHVIIGQRLGDYFRDAAGNGLFREPMLEHLSELIRDADQLDDNFRKHYLNDNTVNTNRIVLSNLREAPALGAAVDAWLSTKTER